MNRWLIVVVIGLTVVGCAAGVEDQGPTPAPEPEQKDPPAQTFSSNINENPYDGIIQGGLGGDAPSIPPRQKPPVPGLQPASE